MLTFSFFFYLFFFLVNLKDLVNVCLKKKKYPLFAAFYSSDSVHLPSECLECCCCSANCSCSCCCCCRVELPNDRCCWWGCSWKQAATFSIWQWNKDNNKYVDECSIINWKLNVKFYICAFNCCCCCCCSYCCF